MFLPISKVESILAGVREGEEYYLKTIRPFSHTFPFPELTDVFDLGDGFLLYLFSIVGISGKYALG
jgi:hypothetical protein